jgi:hypothetical protein
MCNILSIDRASSSVCNALFFLWVVFYLCSLLPCTFDGWVPSLDFYLQDRGNTDCVPVIVEVLIFYTMNLEHPHRCSVCM